MSVVDLKRIFEPKSVAVVGGSRAKGSVGRIVLKNLASGGFEGPVYPVNPKYRTIDGVRCYPGVLDLPEAVDLAIVCTPAPTVPTIVRECGERGIWGLVVLSAGFRESGPSGKALEQDIAKKAQAFGGMRIVGPNCLGILVPRARLNASFAAGFPESGSVAFVSQSGALCTAILDRALEEKIGFSHFVSLGNSLDVGVGDVIDYLAEDPNTKSIVLYVESIEDARTFLSAARAFAREKPIVVYKAGRFRESAAAAVSHTGALAGSDAAYDAAFRRAGAVRVLESTELFDCAELLARGKLPAGPRLAIVTNAGGPGVMATDALLARRGELAKLSDETLTRLSEALPPAASRSNPVDVLGDATPERAAKAVEIVLADPDVDALLAIFTPQAMSEPTESAAAIIEVATRSPKPTLASWMGGQSMRRAISLFNEAGVPTFAAPEQAVHAFMYLVTYARARQTLYETPCESRAQRSLDRQTLRESCEAVLEASGDVASEHVSKALLTAYGISVAETRIARSVDEAVSFAGEIGYPVALKVASPQITHKSDVGGVALNLGNAEDVRRACDEIVLSAKTKRPDARIEGFAVQRMFDGRNGRELILGAKRDASFGAVLLVGAGGTDAELYRDTAIDLPPLNETLARRMVESLRLWPLLQAHRGRAAVAIDRLIDAIVRFSYLVADFPEIEEIDVNPLLVTPDAAIALDARVVLSKNLRSASSRPYAHLAIRPYPDEYVRQVTLRDGTALRIAPIRPEDEDDWRRFVEGCSKQSQERRFRGQFKEATHAMASRFCFVDYDREIALVAEAGEGDNREIVAVGRVVSDSDRERAELALLVADAYQRRGLGTVLAEDCLKICDDWGVHEVVAETAPDNTAMLRILQSRKFQLDRSQSPDAVRARKGLP